MGARRRAPAAWDEEGLDVGHAVAAAFLDGVLDVSALLRADVGDGVLLDALARAIAERLGFATVALNVFRPHTGTFEVAVCVGDLRVREALLGSSTTVADWEPMLGPARDAGGARFLPAGTVDWHRRGAPTSYIPPERLQAGADAWQPEDALLVPLRDAAGSWLAIVSVDEPLTGRRPTSSQLAVLEAFCAHMASVLELAKLRAGAARRSEALLRLAELSASVHRRSDVREALADIVAATVAALGYARVEAFADDGERVRMHVRSSASSLEADEPKEEQVEGDAGGPSVCALRSQDGTAIGTLRAWGPGQADLHEPDRVALLRAFADLAEAVVSSASYDALRLSEARKDAMVGASLDAIVTIDAAGRVVELNPAATRLLRPPPHAIGMDAAQLILAPDARSPHLGGIDALLDALGGTGHRRELAAMRGDDSSFTAEAAIAAFETAGSSMYTVFLRDITDRALARLQLEAQRDAEHHAATHDALTGLLNRDGFREHVGTPEALAGRTLIKVSLDSVPAILEGFGHELASSMLATRGRELAQLVASVGPFARTGEHTFALLAPSADGAALAERLRVVAGAPFRSNELTLLSSVTVGMADAREAGGASELLRRADVARHRSRTSGGAPAHYDVGDDTAAQRLHDAAALRRAIDDGDLVLHYQPLVSVRTGAVIGLEALVRCTAANGSLVPPGLFIPIAESTGLIAPVGEWVIAEACRQSAAWRRQGLRVPCIAVNVSPHQLPYHDVAALIGAALRREGLTGAALCVEVTETALDTRPEEVHRLLRDLKALGVLRALDDFGAEYSSLARLAALDVDIVKIDRGFLTRVPGDPGATALFEAISHVTRATGATVVAEGVECQPQLDLLRRAGIDTAQGFLFARPAPAAEIAVHLEADVDDTGAADRQEPPGQAAASSRSTRSSRSSATRSKVSCGSGASAPGRAI